MDDLWTVKDASKFLNIKVWTLYSYAERKMIPHSKLGKRLLRFDRKLLEEWVRERTYVPVPKRMDIR